ncbi:MAG: hypothetical protein M1343_08415 [Chloroflexi bacterium]|nr:hypothetical protein [Chloroflexota bacterium]
MKPTFEKTGVRLGRAHLDIADMSDRDLVAYEDKNERYFVARLGQLVKRMAERYTLYDLMEIAGVEGQPRDAMRLDERGRPILNEMPYGENDVIDAEDGDSFILTYDDGRSEQQIQVTIPAAYSASARKARQQRKAALQSIDFTTSDAIVQTLADAAKRSDEGKVQALLTALKNGKADTEAVFKAFGEWQLDFLSEFGSKSVADDYNFDEAENALQLSEDAANKALDFVLDQVSVGKDTEDDDTGEAPDDEASGDMSDMSDEMMAAARKAKRAIGFRLIRGEDYPWDQCMSDQKEAGYSDEDAQKICGAIYWKNHGKGSKSGQKRKAAVIDWNEDTVAQYAGQWLWRNSEGSQTKTFHIKYEAVGDKWRLSLEDGFLITKGYLYTTPELIEYLKDGDARPEGATVSKANRCKADGLMKGSRMAKQRRNAEGAGLSYSTAEDVARILQENHPDPQRRYAPIDAAAVLSHVHLIWGPKEQQWLDSASAQEIADRIEGAWQKWNTGSKRKADDDLAAPANAPDKSYSPSDALETLTIPEFNQKASEYAFQVQPFGAFKDKWNRYWDYVPDGSGNRIYYTRDEKKEATASRKRKADPNAVAIVFAVGQKVELAQGAAGLVDIPVGSAGTVEDSDGTNYLISFENGPRWVSGFWLVEPGEKEEEEPQELTPQDAMQEGVSDLFDDADEQIESDKPDQEGVVAQRLKQSVKAEVARRRARAQKDLQPFVDIGMIQGRERYASLLSTLSALSEEQYTTVIEMFRAKSAQAAKVEAKSIAKVASTEHPEDNGYQAPLITAARNDSEEEGLGLRFTVIGSGHHLR